MKVIGSRATSILIFVCCLSFEALQVMAQGSKGMICPEEYGYMCPPGVRKRFEGPDGEGTDGGALAKMDGTAPGNSKRFELPISAVDVRSEKDEAAVNDDDRLKKQRLLQMVAVDKKDAPTDSSTNQHRRDSKAETLLLIRRLIEGIDRILDKKSIED